MNEENTNVETTEAEVATAEETACPCCDEFEEDVEIHFGSNEQLRQVAEVLGFCPKTQKDLIATIVAKGISLFLGILFWVLRSKAINDGKVCKSRIFLGLSLLFFVGVLTSRVETGDEEDDEFDEEFEEEFN